MNVSRVLLLLALAGVTALCGCGWFAEDRDVTTRSDEAYAAYKEGRADLARFRFQDAIADFTRATELDPQFAIAYADLAITYRRLGQYQESQKTIERALELRDQGSEIERLWIDHLYAGVMGDPVKADESYQQMLDQFPEHKWTLRLRAEEAKKRSDFDGAMACYDKILAADPEAVEVHNLKGYLYLSNGDYDEAVESLRRYAFYSPDQANPHDSLGEAFLSIGRFDEAISEFVKALEIDPTFIWSGVHLAQALAITGQIDKAHSVLDQMKPMFEERRWLSWWNMESGQIDYRGERWNELLARLDKLPDKSDMKEIGSEYSLWVRYARTIALLELGDLTRATESLRELEKQAESFSEENKSLARISDVMRLNYAYVESRFQRASGNPTSGIPALEKAIEGSKLSPHELALFRYELATAHLEAGEPEQAILACNALLDVIPTAPSLNLVAAQALESMGNREHALEHLRTYMDVMRNADPGLPQLARATSLLQRLVPRS